MKISNLKLGRIYIVAGQGEMKLTELPDPPHKTTVIFRTPWGTTYSAGPEQIVCEAKKANIQARKQALIDRGKADQANELQALWDSRSR